MSPRALLNWLTGHGTSLAELTQAHLDLWQAEGATTRRIAEHFLKWAIKTKTAPAGLTIVPHRRGTSAKLDKTGQDEALGRVLHSGGEIEARDQAAAILVLVFGQQAERVARLTWEDVRPHLRVQKSRAAPYLPRLLQETLRYLLRPRSACQAHYTQA